MIIRMLTAALSAQLAVGIVLAQDNVLSEAEKAQGFSLLFDGTLAGFKTNFVNYEKNNPNTTALGSGWVVNPVSKIIDCPTGTPGDIRSKKQYRDFDFRMDYRNDVNQGVYYRFMLTGDVAWQTGVEFAIDNDLSITAKSSAGAAYGLYPPIPQTYNTYATNKWNSMRIVVKADSVEHWMNGSKIVGYKYHSAGFWAAYAVSKWNASNTLTYKTPGNRANGYIETGYIGFQGDHNGKWQMKNIRISESPCFGPPSETRTTAECNPSAIGQVAEPGEGIGRAALHRTGSGVTLDLRGLDVREVSLTTLDGKTIRGELDRNSSEAVFTGGFRSGLYFVRMKTANGDVSGKIKLL